MIKKYKLLIPTLILTILVALTFINSGTDYSLTVQHYAGLVSTIMCLSSFFFFRQYYKYVLGTTLVLGLINLMNFTPAQTTTSVNFNSLSIGFQTYSLFLIILTVLLVVPKKSERTIVQSEKTSKISETEFKEDLEKFIKLYSTKSDQELNNIINDKRFSEAAKEAAKKLLSHRGSV